MCFCLLVILVCLCLIFVLYCLCLTAISVCQCLPLPAVCLGMTNTLSGLFLPFDFVCLFLIFTAVYIYLFFYSCLFLTRILVCFCLILTRFCSFLILTPVCLCSILTLVCLSSSVPTPHSLTYPLTSEATLYVPLWCSSDNRYITTPNRNDTNRRINKQLSKQRNQHQQTEKKVTLLFFSFFLPLSPTTYIYVFSPNCRREVPLHLLSLSQYSGCATLFLRPGIAIIKSG